MEFAMIISGINYGDYGGFILLRFFSKNIFSILVFVFVINNDFFMIILVYNFFFQMNSFFLAPVCEFFFHPHARINIMEKCENFFFQNASLFLLLVFQKIKRMKKNIHLNTSPQKISTISIDRLENKKLNEMITTKRFFFTSGILFC